MTRVTFQVRHIKWWHRPVPLMARKGAGFEQVGWLWNQRAYLVNNLHHGWIGFVEDQTPENIEVWFCHHCGTSLMGSARDKIEEHLRPPA